MGVRVGVEEEEAFLILFTNGFPDSDKSFSERRAECLGLNEGGCWDFHVYKIYI